MLQLHAQRRRLFQLTLFGLKVIRTFLNWLIIHNYYAIKNIKNVLVKQSNSTIKVRYKNNFSIVSTTSIVSVILILYLLIIYKILSVLLDKIIFVKIFENIILVCNIIGKNNQYIFNHIKIFRYIKFCF